MIFLVTRLELELSQFSRMQQLRMLIRSRRDPEVALTSPSCIKTGKMAADTQVCVAGFY